MGVYFNPGNDGFKRMLKGKYVDKTGMIGLINARLNSTDGLVCVSRPRRFGKSFAVDMLCAYYDHTCDSHTLFDGLEAGSLPSGVEYMNQFHVISLDMAGALSKLKRKEKKINSIVDYVSEGIRKELVQAYPELAELGDVSDCIEKCVEITGRRFVFLIDEWDAVIREAKEDVETQESYLDLLREWFKNRNFTPKVVAAAYMTGILPIKKDGTESAVSDFHEYTILEPGEFAKYTGFTEDEVKLLCEEKKVSFASMKEWYDGYQVGSEHSVYNPYSVMKALEEGHFKSYWRKTSMAEALKTYINIDQYGINEEIVKLTAGEKLQTDTSTFNNDFESFACKDDVLTLMIHLGYLTYDEETAKAWIPNEEVRLEYNTLVRKPTNSNLARLIRMSEKLLSDTLEGKEKEVAQAIEQVRESNYAPQFYNHEQALRYAIKFAYIVCVDRFLKIEELPSGRGLADVVFLPKRDSAYPAIIIELKWDRDKEEALNQIDEKKYATALEGYVGTVVMVGISYDSEKKVHDCRIERTMRG